MKWERGDISFIFMGEEKPSQSLFVLDNRLKVYQKVRYEVTIAFILALNHNENVVFQLVHNY